MEGIRGKGEFLVWPGFVAVCEIRMIFFELPGISRFTSNREAHVHDVLRGMDCIGPWVAVSSYPLCRFCKWETSLHN